MVSPLRVGHEETINRLSSVAGVMRYFNSNKRFHHQPKAPPKPNCGPGTSNTRESVVGRDFESLASKSPTWVDRSATTRCPALKRGGISLESRMAGTARNTPGGRE